MSASGHLTRLTSLWPPFAVLGSPPAALAGPDWRMTTTDAAPAAGPDPSQTTTEN